MAARLTLWLLALLLMGAAPAKPVGKRAAGPAPVVLRELMIDVKEPALVWRWRAAADIGAEPTLLRAMRGEAMVALGKDRAEARAVMAGASAEGYPFRRYETSTDWKVVASTPRLLVILGESWAYTGGAHGNSGFAARLWDRRAQRSMTVDALFSDWPRARRLIEPFYCRELERMRREKRGPEKLDDDFEACPPLAQQIVYPFGSPTSGVADQLRVMLPPYAAGPYVEGSYEVSLAWPEGIGAMVAPAWKATLGTE